MSSTTITPQQTTTRNMAPVLFLITLAVIVLDRITKLWIARNLPSGSAIVVIPHIFRITHVLNTGAAFSLFENLSPRLVRLGLVTFSAIAIVLVTIMLIRIARTLTLSSIALALILGGAIGNLYDRILLHHVIDFLEVTIVHYHWPDFNVADSCIVIGACLLLIEIFRAQPTDS